MPHAELLGAEVFFGRGGAGHLAGDALGHGDAGVFEGADLVRVVGDEPDGVDGLPELPVGEGRAGNS